MQLREAGIGRVFRKVRRWRRFKAFAFARYRMPDIEFPCVKELSLRKWVKGTVCSMPPVHGVAYDRASQ